MRIKLKTLTPIWTGGVEKYCDRIHETGIIGSIRWWYEAIVRGLGGNVCNIIEAETSCPTKDASGNKYCDVCELFGATGKSRAFRLEIDEVDEECGSLTQDEYDKKKPINIRPSKRTRGWFTGAGRYTIDGTFININIVNLRDSEDSLSSKLIPVFKLINNWTAIGSRTQHGFGVVKITDDQGNDLEGPEDFSLPAAKEDIRYLPNIKDFFFTRLNIFPKNEDDWMNDIDGLKNTMTANPDLRRYIPYLDQRIEKMPNSIPIAPAVKNWLRFTFFPTFKKNKNCEQFVFGKSINKDKQASKISVSDAYKVGDKWEFRIWGWLPAANQTFQANHRSDFINNLKENLAAPLELTSKLEEFLGNNKIEMIEWREFNSENDTVDKKQNDINKYLISLLK